MALSGQMHPEPPDVMHGAEALRQVVHSRVEGEEAPHRPGWGTGALLDQFVHLGDRPQVLQQFVGEGQSARQGW